LTTASFSNRLVNQLYPSLSLIHRFGDDVR
jgi:hypothetical protein